MNSLKIVPKTVVIHHCRVFVTISYKLVFTLESQVETHSYVCTIEKSNHNTFFNLNTKSNLVIQLQGSYRYNNQHWAL